MTNVELEAAEAKIAELKAELADKTQQIQDQATALNATQLDLHLVWASEAQLTVEKGLLEKEVAQLKETIIRMVTEQQQAPRSSTPHSPSSVNNMLAQMISSEESEQQARWGQ